MNAVQLSKYSDFATYFSVKWLERHHIVSTCVNIIISLSRNPSWIFINIVTESTPNILRIGYRFCENPLAVLETRPWTYRAGTARQV
jgi:hypothetical protein